MPTIHASTVASSTLLNEATYDKIETVMAMIRAELTRAVAKHASMHSPHEGHSVIREELDELWEHVKADTGQTTAALKEAIQVATMGARYAVDLCNVEDKIDGRG